MNAMGHGQSKWRPLRLYVDEHQKIEIQVLYLHIVFTSFFSFFFFFFFYTLLVKFWLKYCKVNGEL